MRRSRASQGGFSMATTLIIVALVGGIASALIILSSNQMSVDQKTRDKVRATYLAEAGVEHLAFLIRKAHANSVDLTIPTGSTKDAPVVDGFTLDCLDLKGSDGIAETVSTVTMIDGRRISLTAERFLEKAPLPATDENFDPLEAQTTTLMYSLTAELRYAGAVEDKKTLDLNMDENLRRVHGTSLGRVVRVLEYKVTPIFDKFAFWNGRMEILPGPNAIFNGRVHTNSDLYIGSGGGLTINTDYLRANGNMFRHRYDDPAGSSTNYVQIRDPYKDPYSAQGQLGDNMWDWKMSYESAADYNTGWNEDANWVDQLGDPKLDGKIKNKNFGGDDKSLFLEPPKVEIKDPGGDYYNNADIVIKDTTVYQRVGNNPDGSPVLVDITASLPADAIKTSTVYDAREGIDGNPATNNNGTHVPVTVLDVSKLEPGKGFPNNGVIYAYRTKTKAADSTSPRVIEGVQLVNGSKLPANMTFVTNGPAYVQGDFNVGTDRKGAAVIADAVNLLSNGWSNTKTKGNGTPAAKTTEYNFALVTGNTPTDHSMPAGLRYSGGLENLPRFHENWAGVDMKYQGSLMCLWESKIATGRWGKGSVYSPPNRRWDFDARFGDPDSPAKPPRFPQTVSISRTTYVEGYPVASEEKAP